MFTLPKFTFVVLNDKVGVAATPVPVRLMTLGEAPALLTREMLPLAEPATDGWNCALNVLVWPGLMESGKFNPLVLKPLPVALAWVIVSVAFPGLPIRIVCELAAPTTTLPRFALDGVKLMAACKPVPLTATTALVPCVLATVIFPLIVSAAAGLNFTLIACDWPGASVRGSVNPLCVTSFALTVT